MSTPHTAAPWTTERCHLGQWIKAGESFIAPLPDHIEHEGESCGSIASQDKTQAEIDANARLIAAAPELLEVAVAYLAMHGDCFFDSCGGNCLPCMARAAIQKAQGDSTVSAALRLLDETKAVRKAHLAEWDREIIRNRMKEEFAKQPYHEGIPDDSFQRIDISDLTKKPTA